MPVEDLLDLVNSFDLKKETEEFQTKSAVLFIFGTNFS